VLLFIDFNVGTRVHSTTYLVTVPVVVLLLLPLLLAGELLSFHLSRLLELDNVPPVMLSRLDTGSEQWTGHDLARVHWLPGTLVALIQWIDDLNHRRSVWSGHCRLLVCAVVC